MSTLMRRLRQSSSSDTAVSDTLETLVVIPPDGGWGWMVVAAAFVCNCVADGAVYSFGLFLEDISKTYNVHPTVVGYANSIIVGFTYSLGPIFCSLVNRFGFRVVGFVGGLMSATAFYFSQLAPNILYFLVILGGFAGCGFGMIYVASLIAVGLYFEKWRSLATSIAITGVSTGLFLFPIISEKLLNGFKWQEKFEVMAVLCLLTSLLGLVYRPIKPVSVTGPHGFSMEQLVLSDAVSMVSGRSRLMSNRYHNTNYPTMADVMSISSPDVSRGRSMSRASARRAANRHQLCLCRCCMDFWSWFKRKMTNQARPMYRDDILLQGDVNWKQYTSTETIAIGKGYSQSYSMTVSRVLTQRDLLQNHELCVCCTESIIRPLTTMFDFSLLLIPSFSLLTLSGFFAMLGMYTPFVYMKERATKFGIDAMMCSYMISAMGITNAMGRILGGMIASVPKIGPLQVSIFTCLISGLFTIVSAKCRDVYTQYLYAAVFGLTIASHMALKTAVLVDMYGLENLTNGFGIVLMFQGFAGFIGVPIAGALMQATHSYNTSFYFSGLCLTVAALLMMPMPKVRAWELRSGRY